MADMEPAAGAAAASKALLNEIDTALRPAGMLRDLSRVIAEFARPSVRWVDDRRITVCETAEGGCTATVKRGVRSGGFAWIVSDLPIGQFPAPPTPSSSDCKGPSELRVWTVRVDTAAFGMYFGACKWSTALQPAAALAPDHFVTVCTHDGGVRTGPGARADGLPYSEPNEAAGSLYQFTADLSTGSLRVRPIIKRLHPSYQPTDKNQTEWTIAEGLTDLAECRAAALVHAGSPYPAFTLLA
jgi:hypothetical protein